MRIVKSKNSLAKSLLKIINVLFKNENYFSSQRHYFHNMFRRCMKIHFRYGFNPQSEQSLTISEKLNIIF